MHLVIHGNQLHNTLLLEAFTAICLNENQMRGVEGGECCLDVSVFVSQSNKSTCKKHSSSSVVVKANIALPVGLSQWFAALPPRDHTPRRHLGLALDERVSSYLHQRLAPQLIVRKIWGNS